MNIIFWTGVFDFKMHYRAIGPYQLAWWMRSNGYDCQVIDFIHWMNLDELVEITEKFITKNTLCIGVSSTFWADLNPKTPNWPMTRIEKNQVPDIISSAIKILRSRHPQVKFVLGGHTADFVSNECYGLFDASMIGDAEDSFLNLVDSWKENKKIFHAVTRGGKPFIITDPNKSFDIAKLSHRFIDNDCILPGETLPIEISRGCIFKCAFCQYPHIGKTKFDYLREFEKIGEEMTYNFNKFNTLNYYILDDTFNDSDFKMQGWNSTVNQLENKINFTAYLRADLLHRNSDHIDILKNTGLVSGFFGIESFNPEASRLVGKGWSGKEGKNFLIDLKKQWGNDVTFFLSFIVGLPPERAKDYLETLQWCIDNEMHSWVFKPLLITPGFRTMNSDLDKNYEKYGFSYNAENKSWATKYMNSVIANQLGIFLNKKTKNVKKIASWGALSLMGLGLDKKEINTKLGSELDWKFIRIQQTKFIENYKKKINSL
jgi:radical SAM superfamily enzyme YgiQ (UPF0313 family)